MRTVRDTLRRHPQRVDAGLVVLLIVLGAPRVLDGAGPAEWCWFAAVHAPLIYRRRAPLAVFWAVYVLVLGSTAAIGVRVEGIYPETVVTVAVYTVARYCARKHLWLVVGAIEVPAAVAVLWHGPNWTALGFVTSGLAATVLLGLTVRTRQAYLMELEERARQLERERDQQAQLAVAAERARIARDMHDIVAHNLAVMVALAEGAAYTTGTAPERAADAMRQVSTTGRQALGEMRRLLGLLRDDADGRTPQPGLDDIDGLLDQVRAAGLRVRVSQEGTGDGLGAGVGLAVYRIVQEALTNTLKHAGADACVDICFRYTGCGVDLEICDNGGQHAAAGAGGPSPSGGHGLAGMRERAVAYGGDVESGPRAGAPGWRVRARLRIDGGPA